MIGKSLQLHWFHADPTRRSSTTTPANDVMRFPIMLLRSTVS